MIRKITLLITVTVCIVRSPLDTSSARPGGCSADEPGAAAAAAEPDERPAQPAAAAAEGRAYYNVL